MIVTPVLQVWKLRLKEGKLPESHNCSAEELRFGPSHSGSRVCVLSCNAVLQTMTLLKGLGRPMTLM